MLKQIRKLLGIDKLEIIEEEVLCFLNEGSIKCFEEEIKEKVILFTELSDSFEENKDKEIKFKKKKKDLGNVKKYKKRKKELNTYSEVGVEGDSELYQKLLKSGLNKKELSTIRKNGGF